MPIIEKAKRIINKTKLKSKVQFYKKPRYTSSLKRPESKTNKNQKDKKIQLQESGKERE